jgi:hypothetical protein
MKNVAPIQLDQFDKIKVMSLSLNNIKVNTSIVKIVLSTTNPRVSVFTPLPPRGGMPFENCR